MEAVVVGANEGRKGKGLDRRFTFPAMGMHNLRPRSRHAAVLLFLAMGSQCMAQEAEQPEHFIHNTTVFAEAWGEGVYNSLNIEKTMFISKRVDVHTRLGFGYWKQQGNFYALPVDVGVS